MSRGYIKLDRALENWRYKTKPNYVALWVHLLLKANHQDGMYQDVLIKRGQFTTSLEELKKGTGLSLQQIRTIINKLNNEEITIKTTNKYTLINIVNYDKYQSSSSKSNKQINKQVSELSTIKQQTNNKQITTNKNNKNNNNNKYIEEDNINNARQVALMLDRYREANYDEQAIRDTISVFDKCKVAITTNLFPKVLDVIENKDIFNKEGYCYELFKSEGLI